MYFRLYPLHSYKFMHIRILGRNGYDTEMLIKGIASRLKSVASNIGACNSPSLELKFSKLVNK